MIQFKNINKSYSFNGETRTALHQVNLTIPDCEVFGVIGESGAGKSTLIRLINGLEKPDSGQLLVDGQNILTYSSKTLNAYRKETAMIFQHFNLLANRTVYDNVRLPLSLSGQTHLLTPEEAIDFVGLTKHSKHYPSQLSGGQKQRVGIARALVSHPKYLLCDEPTSALDSRMAQEIVELLQTIHKNFSMTMIIVSHDLNIITALANRVAILETGQVTDLIDLSSKMSAQPAQQHASYRQQALEVLHCV